jgi:hypothetical protein
MEKAFSKVTGKDPNLDSGFSNYKLASSLHNFSVTF